MGIISIYKKQKYSRTIRPRKKLKPVLESAGQKLLFAHRFFGRLCSEIETNAAPYCTVYTVKEHTETENRKISAFIREMSKNKIVNFEI